MRLVFIFIYLIRFLFAIPLCAQFYNSGQAPASVKWEQIKTENFQIIYPSGFFKTANHAANLLEHYYTLVSADDKIKPRKISILLYNQSVKSNGLVSWAPKRAEWITTPPQDSYPQEWIEQLAIHEFRHVVQMSNLGQGLTKILGLLVGQAAIGAISGFFPLWYLEGDAVLAETTFSSSGRGRLSDFDMELRSIELDRPKRFSYDQSYLGSYRYSIPNYYKYGYQMVTFGKLKYGNNFWKGTVEQIAKKPFQIAPFYFGMHKQVQTSKTKIYSQTFDSLKILWNSSKYIKSLSDTLKIICNNKELYRDYKYPQLIGDSIFSVRTGIDDITRFVMLYDSNEIIVHTPGSYYGTKVDANSNYVVWEEIVNDLRWAQRNYSVLKLYNFKTKKEYKISNNSRYFSPCLSNSGSRLVCLENDSENRNSLVIMEVPSGKVMQKIPLLEYDEISSPAWIDERTLVCIAQGENAKKIVVIHMDDLIPRELFNSGAINIDHLAAGDGKVFFTFDYELAKNIYSLSLDSGKVIRITRTRHGVDFPEYDPGSKSLIFSEYTANGFRPRQMFEKLVTHEILEGIEKYHHPWAESLTDLSDSAITYNRDSEKQYSSKSYNRLSHIFYIHSWAPFYFDLNDFMELQPKIYPGFTILSQNMLSTVTSSFSYYYKDNIHSIEPKIKMEGLYPVFEFSFLLTNSSKSDSLPQGVEPTSNEKPFYSLTASSYLPIDFTRNKFLRYFRPEVSYRYLNVYYFSNNSLHVGSDLFGFRIYAYNLLKQSHRDIQPRFGQTLYCSYFQPLVAKDFFSSVITVSFNQYFPGFVLPHSIKINIAYEKFENENRHLLNNQIDLPRGYESNLFYYQQMKASLEYVFPFLYPDCSVGPLAYFKRFHATVFLDASQVKYPHQLNNRTITSTEIFVSTGLILSSEVHFLRFFMPFTPNLRISYVPTDHALDLGFSMNINTNGY
jgi:hypothetical protein